MWKTDEYFRYSWSSKMSLMWFLEKDLWLGTGVVPQGNNLFLLKKIASGIC